MSKSKIPILQPRLRIRIGDDIALGPGKADLLEQIAQTGSIADAAKGMGMSYMRAWLLVRTMNAQFRLPLVQANRGGKEKGGAVLTTTGQQALGLYRKLEADCECGTRGTWRRLRELLTARTK